MAWHPDALAAVQAFGNRAWINLDNQSPIIAGINDDPEALRILQREMRRNGIENHYFFCGRDIVGHKAFNVPIEQRMGNIERVPAGPVRGRGARASFDHALQG